MDILENIKVSLRSIRSNFLRALLTLLIIAVGITCLVGILTAIDTILFSMSNSFNRMGANSMYIYPANNNMHSRRGGKQIKESDPISYKQAMDFKKKYNFPTAQVSVNTFCKWNSTVKYGKEKTNPNVRLVGIDDSYLLGSSYELLAGRNFSDNEINNGEHKIILGYDVLSTLFNKRAEQAIGKIVHVGNTRYKVVGVLEGKGSSMTTSNDRRVFIPILNAKRYYGNADRNYSLMAYIKDPTQIENASSVAIGVMRNVRKLKATEENDFTIRKSDGILQTLKESRYSLKQYLNGNYHFLQ